MPSRRIPRVDDGERVKLGSRVLEEPVGIRSVVDHAHGIGYHLEVVLLRWDLIPTPYFAVYLRGT